MKNIIMIAFDKIENRFIIPLSVFLSIVIIGFIDYKTGEEFGFSFFYLIPISFLSLYRGTKVFTIIICSFLASILWFTAEYLVRDYSTLFFPIWNTFVRLIIFIAIGLLLFYLKEKEKELKLINSNLKTLNDEKNKFIGIAAHDLRSPLSGIYSFADLLIENYKEKLSPEIIDVLDIIKNTSSNSLAVLENLLDISKIESGKVILKLKTQDYISFVKHQISLNQLLAKKKEIAIVLKSQKESLTFDFDEQYLSEVINNLLSNAIKYSNRNTEITVNISLQNNNKVLTEVIDNGIGIPEEEQQNLFKYFQTTSSLPTDGEKSTGLGLAIAKQIIILHNGTIGIKSFQNQGSNFFYQLPINK